MFSLKDFPKTSEPNKNNLIYLGNMKHNKYILLLKNNPSYKQKKNQQYNDKFQIGNLIGY